jgi:hypothetical protein
VKKIAVCQWKYAAIQDNGLFPIGLMDDIPPEKEFPKVSAGQRIQFPLSGFDSLSVSPLVVQLHSYSHR